MITKVYRPPNMDQALFLALSVIHLILVTTLCAGTMTVTIICIRKLRPRDSEGLAEVADGGTKSPDY